MISPQASVRFLQMYIPRPFHLAPVFPSAPPLLLLAPSSSSKKRHIRNTAIFQGLCLWLHRQTVQAPSRPNTETLLSDPTGKPARWETRGVGSVLLNKGITANKHNTLVLNKTGKRIKHFYFLKLFYFKNCYWNEYLRLDRRAAHTWIDTMPKHLNCTSVSIPQTSSWLRSLCEDAAVRHGAFFSHNT